MVKGPRSIALAAALGTFLQGWDNAACAGALLYLQVEFDLDAHPTIEGLVVAMPLIGALVACTGAGSAADALGRKPVLSVCALCYTIAGLVMFWSPAIPVLLTARFILGMGIGLSIAVIPILISETAPTEIRGQLNTLPYFLLCVGLLMEYTIVFVLSLTGNPSWRLILGLVFFPALIYFGLTTFYLPESPRWLVSKGRMVEAAEVLRSIRGQEDVSNELALLVEGLGVGVNASLEEWIVKPAEMAEILDPANIDEGKITLFGPGGPEEDVAWVAQPVTDETGKPFLAAQRSGDGLTLVDEMVSFFGDIQPGPDALESVDEEYEKRNVYAEDEEFEPPEALRGNGYSSDDHEDQPATGGDVDETNTAPLLRKRTSSRPDVLPGRNASAISNRSSFLGLSSRASSRPVDDMFGQTVDSVGIGGGWQLAWRADAEEGRYERVYLRQEGVDMSRYGSHMSLPSVDFNAFNADGEAFPAMALIGPSVQFNKDIISNLDNAVGPAVVHPSQNATAGPAWAELLEPGVRRALLVGVGIQSLQQLCGISAVLYYTPSILQQSGADKIADSLGLNSNSASILESLFTTLLMVPCVVAAMRLIDRAGRRRLLILTIPVLALSLLVVILASLLLPEGGLQGAISFLGVAAFICVFVTGFGPIPNVLTSEIFPTRVRGVCIGIACFLMWISNITLSFAFPTIVAIIGLNGVFLFFTIMCLVSWAFVYLRVPETKGLPLEIISEFFAMGAQPVPSKQQQSAGAEKTAGIV